MKRQLAHARSAKQTHGSQLLRKQNVVGVGLGYRTKGGETTDEMSVVVSVTRKMPASALSPKNLVPRFVEGVRTDVVETGLMRALPAAAESLGPRDRWRSVVPPGVSVGHYLVTAGTFGCLVHREEELFILSNNHVLANSNSYQLWDPILQPGTADGGGPEDRIGVLHEAVDLVFESEAPDCQLADLTARLLNSIAHAVGSFHVLKAVKQTGGTNRVDAAIAKPFQPATLTHEILGIGAPDGMGAAYLGTRVQKSGRTTGVTEGVITQVEATVRIDYFGATALFENQLIANSMSEGGDSGSAVLDMQRRVVGLLFAGSPVTTILNPIDAVLSALAIQLV